MGPAARSSTTTATTCCSCSTARERRRARRAGRGPRLRHAATGSSPSAAAPTRCSTGCATRLRRRRRRDRGGGRLPHPRRADRRLRPGARARSTSASTTLEAEVLERPRQRAAADDLPAQAGARRAAAPSRRAQRDILPEAVERSSALPGLEPRRARLAARRLRPPACAIAERPRTASPTTCSGAHRHLLQRQRQPAEPARDQLTSSARLLPALDARHRLLRAELRLAGATTSTRKRDFLVFGVGGAGRRRTVVARASSSWRRRRDWL